MATREEQLAQLASIKSQALDIQATLNERQAAERNTPTVTPLTNNEGAIDAATLRSGGTPNMPEPTAQNVAESFQGGLQASTAAARTNLDATLKTERDAALKRQDDLNKKQERLVQDSNPENRATFQQEQRVVQNQMDAAETASASLEEDFNKRRSVVNELETVLTQGNQLIEQARGAPISRYRNAGVAEAMQNVQARAGVLNAVISGLDGNFNAAHSIINNTRTAVAAQWTDQLNYNKTYMDLVSSGQLAKNKINDDYASTQITLAESKLSQLEATAETINNLMIDPESAQFMADAGITLNDSVEEINAKMSEQTKVQERQDVMNELKKEGYEYVPFPGDREDVVSLDVGGKTLSFVAPVDEMEELRKEKLQADIDKVRGSAVSNVTIPGTITNTVATSGVMGSDVDPIPGIIAATAGGRLLTQSEAEPFTNAKRVAAGLQDLQDTLANANTDPILGVFKRINPYNLEAATIDAAITQLVPQLARGTYGEVGVLTDADVARYSDTLPNLTSTADQNKAIMALTLRKVRSGFVSQLESMAAAGRDVSGFAGIYSDFNQQISSLEDEIGVGQPQNQNFDEEYDKEFSKESDEEEQEKGGFWKSVGNFFFGN